MVTALTDELYGISLRGDVSELTKWREKNPNLPLNPKFTAHLRTPLHIAAMCGHVKFAEELCRLDRKLAKEKDTHDYTPLHLASERPSVCMVKKLLDVDTGVCMDKDEDGRTPIYLAAMEDRYKIIEALIKMKPEAIHIRYAQNETILHLCVEHDSLKSLKLLLVKDLPHGDAQSMNMDVISINS
ncbi:ankyrin repeat-containing protein BDA1-like [Papaver somniferum]|uniref:ankyrin repeat-containing protein BDA1-like n=1 Tax=Papaver somniferum TaxID=3469 RepID=UPI000E704371|nr:ankyrin repeat-containing protein BDA1-like [Papaver somniferum]